MSFAEFFEIATDNKPYDYQCRLACGDNAERVNAEKLLNGTECLSRLVSIPTGLGKTAAVTLAWLWNRVALGNDAWPRRLVYCLPMRTLVEQTASEVEKWLKQLVDSGKYLNAREDLLWILDHSPIILMGGEENDVARRDWDIHPEKPAILIGTQDMLLSRALNRGYGMSRARWPMHFSLLNNDALWLFDETQLMGPGLWTSAQLDWLRNDRFKPSRPCASWWLSATIGTSFLDTRDRKDAIAVGTLDPLAAIVEITADEAEELDVLQAKRPIEFWTSAAFKGKTNAKKTDENPMDIFLAKLSKSVCNEHQMGTLSLVVCNSVATAQKVFNNIKSQMPESGSEVALLTSRFRMRDRREHLGKLFAFEDARKKGVREQKPCDHPGLICVSTQVVEAGVDISACRLWTELAPWPSIIQRIGRLNRDGKLNHEAKAFVFEVPVKKSGDKKGVPVGPYLAEDLTDAKKIVSALAIRYTKEPDKSIRDILNLLKADKTIANVIEKSLQPKLEPFPRAFDVHGLFSTEPDAFGGFTDVSPWVRSSDANADVTVFWRNWDEVKITLKSYKETEWIGPAFQREEGCPVSVHRLRSFVDNTKNAYLWNDKTDTWEPIRSKDIFPGMVILLPANAGGYAKECGWTGIKADKLLDTPPPGPFDDGDKDKLVTTKPQWVSLDAHLAAVGAEAERIGRALALPPAQQTALVHAGTLHDIGKSYLQWQESLPPTRPDATTLWAKAPFFAKRANMRHEAASALAAWHQKYRARTADFSALTIYLIAAHHGFIRTVLSSRPTAPLPNIAGILIVEPPPVLMWRAKAEETWPLDFICAQDGTDGVFSEDADGNLIFTPVAPGWTALVADLLGGWEADAPQFSARAIPSNDANEPHSLNPFKLAFLETLLRAADCRVSASEMGIPAQTIFQPVVGRKS